MGTPAGETYILEKEACLSRLSQQEHCGKVLRRFIGNYLLYSCTEQTQKIQAQAGERGKVHNLEAIGNE